MLIREDSQQEQQSVLSIATASVRTQRETLHNLLEETRAAHSKYGAEYRDVQLKLVALETQFGQMQASTEGHRDPEHDIEVAALRDQDSMLKQRQDWLSEKLLELQTTARKLRSVIQQIDDIIDYLASSVGSIQDSDDTSTHLSRVRLLQAQEDERQRLAREIHDGPAQALANAIFEMEYCERLWDKNPEQMKKELGRLKQDLREALADVRYFISDLRPAPLTELGLDPVLRRYIDEYQTRFNIKVNASWQDLGRLPGPQELAIFRIVQETLQNTRKHSGASEVNLRLTQEAESFTITIEDNGTGFDVHRHQDGEGHHFGLTSMSERARLIGGELQITSTSAGTRVALTVPRGKDGAEV